MIPDGTGLLWAASFTGQKITQKITGVDLVDKLAKLSAKKGYKIFFLGANPGIAKQSADILTKKYPGMKVAGYSSASPKLEQSDKPQFQFPYNSRITDIKPAKTNPNAKITQMIRDAKPDILLVAYGHPKQELFISRYAKLLRVPVMIGVGGSFDFITGKAQRAPKFMQKLGIDKLGFEWLWRLVCEPQRIGRIYTAVIKFPWAVFVSTIISKK